MEISVREEVSSGLGTKAYGRLQRSDIYSTPFQHFSTHLHAHQGLSYFRERYLV